MNSYGWRRAGARSDESNEASVEFDEATIQEAVNNVSGLLLEKKDSRYLLGAFDGAIVAYECCSQFPDKYAGAYLYHPSTLNCPGIPPRTISRIPSFERQNVFVLHRATKTFVSDYIVEALSNAGATVKREIADEPTFSRGDTINTTGIDVTASKLRWMNGRAD